MPSATNPILMELSGNGSLAGRDRAGAFTATGSGALRYAPAPGARVNQVINARFANDAANWSGTPNAAVSRVADVRFAGGFAGRSVCVAPGTANEGIQTDPGNYKPAIGSAATYTASFDLVVDSGNKDNLIWRIRARDALGAFLTSIGGNLVVPTFGDVYRYSVSAAAITAFQAGTKIGFAILNSVTGSVTFSISNIVVEEGTIPNATYFEGPFLDPRTGMLGTPHASPSVSRAQFWIEEATTNLIINPSFGTNTTSWGTYSDRTITRDTTMPYTGSASCKVTSALLINADAFAMKYSPGITAAGAGSYTYSAWVFVPTTWTGGSICLDVRDFVGGTGAGLKAYANMSTKGVWQRVTNTFTVVGGDLTGNLYVGVDTQWKASEFFYITNIQLEAKAYATSFTDGSIGTGYTWAGTAHASESTRAVASISLANTGRIDIAEGSLAARHRILYSTAVNSQYVLAVGQYGVAGEDSLEHHHNGASLLTRFRAGTTAGKIIDLTDVSVGTSAKSYSSWSGLNGYSENDIDSDTVTRDAVIGSLSTDITIGLKSSAALNGLIGPVAIYDRPLTDAERLMVNNAIDSDGNLWTVLGGSNILIPLTARRRRH